MPSETYEKDGKRKFYPYIHSDSNNFKHDIMKALDKYLESQSPSVKTMASATSQFIPIDQLVQESFL